MREDPTQRLIRLEARSEQHSRDLLEIKHDVRRLVEDLAGVKVRLALVSSAVAVAATQLLRIVF